jgi:hypothetical protein
VARTRVRRGTASGPDDILVVEGIPNSVPEKFEDELAPAVTELASNLDQIDMNTTRQIDVVTHELYDGLGRILKQLGRKRRIYNHRPDWWNEEVDRYRKIYLAKKSLFYRNKISQYTDHLHAEMSAARERFKEKLNKARTRSWDKYRGGWPQVTHF